MTSNDERLQELLRDFVEVGEQGERLVARGRAAYDADEFLRLAAEAVLHRLGEIVMRVDRVEASFVEEHPALEWRRMKNMRNAVAHGYDIVDYNLVWTGLARHLPAEVAYVRGLVAE